MINHDHHPHRKHPNDVIERLHLRISNNPDSQPASTNNESTYNDEHLRDPYSNTMNMNSTQTSPVASSKWSYREQAAPDCMDFSDYTGLLASLVRQEGNIYSLAAIGDMFGPVKCLAVDMSRRDGSGERPFTLYSGSLDRSVKIWRVSAQTPEIDDQKPRRPSHQKDRLRRTHDGGFQTFSAQGRLNQRRK
ncbi:hypothetical protein L2E82_44067 [Cichorium intybus]|uniref:Uncharacterized protein n=1 Tax=Cichorium intybus TaxID=13427 RepID=A0ACB8ZPR4_CICIN|nr:hypothetical protein L2E82_44067 [Cichorium intybus]